MSSILVIEDDPGIRESIVEILHLEDFEVHGAENGLVGVELARQILPDLIISDIVMPHLDGYGVLLELRSDPTTAMIPFIFLTARSGQQEVREGMDLGAEDYLTKPLDTATLLSAVRTRLARHALIMQSYGQRMDDLRNNIVYMVPHEFRTPLNAIIGYSDFFLSDPESVSTEDVVSYMKSIYGAGLRLQHLIENFQVCAQIGIIQSDPQRIEALRQSLTGLPKALIEAQARKQTSKVRREGDLTLDIVEVETIHIHENNLRKIVEELVDNALKFSHPGSPISVTARVREDTYVLTVQDHGRGMSPSQIIQIGAFMQFDRRIYEQQGAGLGLVVVQGLAELHGGHMVINSTPAVQTDVTVSLRL